MTKRMIIMIIALIIVFGSIFGYNYVRSYMIAQYFKTFQMPPVTISATSAKEQSWTPYISTVGTLQAVKGVNITTQVAGIIKKIYFHSGQMVLAGDPIIKIDDRAELANLENNQAELKLQAINLQRAKELYQQRAISKSDLDTAQANFTKAQAAVAQTTALINYKNVVAPFAGKLGIRQVNIGQYISAGTNIVTLQTLAPIYVNFTLPEQDLPKLYNRQPIKISTDIYPQKEFSGHINAIDSTVDVKTHNISVQATLPNKDKKLYPGLFAYVKVILPTQEHVITVPQTAVTYSLFGDSIYVLTPDDGKKDDAGNPIYIAKRVYVTTGEQRNNQVVITKGISAGMKVVTSGQLKLEDKAKVIINNSVNIN